MKEQIVILRDENKCAYQRVLWGHPSEKEPDLGVVV